MRRFLLLGLLVAGLLSPEAGYAQPSDPSNKLSLEALTARPANGGYDGRARSSYRRPAYRPSYRNHGYRPSYASRGYAHAPRLARPGPSYRMPRAAARRAPAAAHGHRR